MNRIVSAEPLPGCRLKVAFNDGLKGTFAVEPERRGGAFLKLLDAKVFNAVTVNPDFGCVEWPEGIDLCPDVMHEAVAGSKSEEERDVATALPSRRIEAKAGHPASRDHATPEPIVHS